MARFLSDKNMRKFSSQIISRGRGYFDDDCVTIDDHDEKDGKLYVYATVYGSFDYGIEMIFDKKTMDILDMYCDCPYGLPCKHEVAVLLQVDKEFGPKMIMDAEPTNYEEKKKAFGEYLTDLNDHHFYKSLNNYDKDKISNFFYGSKEVSKALSYVIDKPSLNPPLKRGIYKIFLGLVYANDIKEVIARLFDYSLGYPDSERGFFFTQALKRNTILIDVFEKIYPSNKEGIDKYIKSQSGVSIVKSDEYINDGYAQKLLKVFEINPTFLDNSTIQMMLLSFMEKNDKKSVLSVLATLPNSKSFFAFSISGGKCLKALSKLLTKEEFESYPLLINGALNQLVSAASLSDYLYWRAFINEEQFEQDKKHILDSYSSYSTLSHAIRFCEGEEKQIPSILSDLPLSDLLSLSKKLKDSQKSFLSELILDSVSKIGNIRTKEPDVIAASFAFLSDYPTKETIEKLVNDTYNDSTKPYEKVREPYLRFLFKLNQLEQVGMHLYKKEAF